MTLHSGYVSIGILLICGCNNPRVQPDSRVQNQIFVAVPDNAGIHFTHTNGMTGRLYIAELMGAGAGWLDYDRDGDLDLFLVQGRMLGNHEQSELLVDWQGDPPCDRLFRNELVPSGHLDFVDVTQESGILGLEYGMGVAVGDYDRNGFPDLYVTNLGNNRLWRNNGDGTFHDATPVALVNDSRWSTAAIFFDYDRDQYLDLFVCNYAEFNANFEKECATPQGTLDYCGPLSFASITDRLFHNNGDGTFEDVTGSSGIASAYGRGLGVIASDLNDDGWLDLYVANDSSANQLWINQGGHRFEDNALMAGCAYNGSGKAEGSMGIEIGDIDGDGQDDLFVTHFVNETNTLYRGKGKGLFEDATDFVNLATASRSLTGFGCAFIDVDNDGDLDLLVANGAVKIKWDQQTKGEIYPLKEPNQLFRNNAGQFEVIKTEPELNKWAVSRAVAMADADNDGDIDVLITESNGPTKLLLNHSQLNWVGFTLLDKQNIEVYGARLTLCLGDGTKLTRCVRVDGSYLSSHDPRVNIGITGRTLSSAYLMVNWPDGGLEKFEGPFIERTYIRVQKGSGIDSH